MIKKEKLKSKLFRLTGVQDKFIKLQAKKLKISEGEVARRMVEVFIKKQGKSYAQK